MYNIKRHSMTTKGTYTEEVKPVSLKDTHEEGIRINKKGFFSLKSFSPEVDAGCVSNCERPGKSSIEQLPYEIRQRIANELSQFDCLNLLLTSKTMYESTIPRLYQHIIVDQHYSDFNKEYDFKKHNPVDGMDSTGQFACSYIRTPYSFKRLVNPNGNSLSAKKSSYMNCLLYIKMLLCINLPDSLNTYDHKIYNSLKEFFKQLHGLRDLVWLSDNFRVEYLINLPNHEAINTLVLNIKYSTYLSEYQQEGEDIFSIQSPDKSMLFFPNLSNFQLMPFQNSRRLKSIVDELLIGDHPENIESQLQVLKLSRFDKERNTLLPSCHDLILSDQNKTLKDFDLGTIGALFHDSKLHYLNNITILLLSNCLLSQEDATCFIESVNLENISTLEMKFVSEYYACHDPMEMIANGNSHTSFILRLAPHLTNLRHLYLDYRESYVDTVPEFLNILPSSKIQSLDLIIRYNETKLQVFHNSINNFYEAYAKALISNGKALLLTKLSVELKEENTFCDLNLPLPSDYFYNDIGRCENLQALRVNPCDRINESKMLDLVRSLKNLNLLDIFGSRAGGAPHLGLAAVHPTIYDEWFKVQPVAFNYLQANLHLQYIRINQCIFEEVKNSANPREGIDRWFELAVRVGSS